MTYRFKLSRRLAAGQRRMYALLAATGLLVACGGSTPTGTTPAGAPGWLTVELISPNNDDGALQIRISGPGVDSVAASTSYDGYGVTSSGAADLVLVGAITNGAVARFRVPDVTRSGQYVATVSAAAQRGSYTLRNAAAYRATIVH